MDETYLDDIARLDSNNFWFRAKQYYLNAIITKEKANILDVGCGSGGNMLDFIKRNYCVLGIDKSNTAVRYCQKKGFKALKLDLEEEKPIQLDFIPDYITVLDFIEHLNNSVKVLEKLLSISRDHTKLIITVPAYQSLWSEWDILMSHSKRYSQALLKKELKEAGWDVERITYIHSPLVLPAILRRKFWYPLVKKMLKSKLKKEEFLNPSKFFNNFLFLFYKPEFLLFKTRVKIPLGLSILAIAHPMHRQRR